MNSRIAAIYAVGCFLVCTALDSRADALLDPTRPATAPAQRVDASAPLRVEAVLRAADRDRAIVNGRLVQVGDRLAGARIEAILPNGVRYTRDGLTRTAYIERGAITVRRSATDIEESK